MSKVIFLKLKGVKKDISLIDTDLGIDEIYTSMNSLVEDIKMCYARDYYWIRKQSFYDGVEIPEDDVSIYEFQTEEGQQKAWNYHLAELTRLYDGGNLLDEKIGNTVYFVIEANGQDIFLMAEFPKATGDFVTPLKTIFDCEDVTDEYTNKMMEAISPDEIEEFVNTHTQDEITEKYATRWIKKHSDNFSMWEW